MKLLQREILRNKLKLKELQGNMETWSSTCYKSWYRSRAKDRKIDYRLSLKFASTQYAHTKVSSCVSSNLDPKAHVSNITNLGQRCKDKSPKEIHQYNSNILIFKLCTKLSN